jgi:hypothetical protein
MHFIGFAVFLCYRWPSWTFLTFWSSICVSFCLGFKIQILCFLLSMDSSRGRLRNQVISNLVWYVMSHWHAEAWIQVWDIFVVLHYYLCSCGESRLLVSWCVGGRYDMTDSDDDHGKSRRTTADDLMHTSGIRWPDYREVGWHHVWSVPCTRRRGAWVSWLSLKTKVDDFSRFDLKTDGSNFSV